MTSAKLRVFPSSILTQIEQSVKVGFRFISNPWGTLDFTHHQDYVNFRNGKERQHRCVVITQQRILESHVQLLMSPNYITRLGITLSTEMALSGYPPSQPRKYIRSAVSSAFIHN